MVKYLDICPSGKGLVPRIQKEHLHISNKRQTTIQNWAKHMNSLQKEIIQMANMNLKWGLTIRNNQIKTTMIPKYSTKWLK